MYQNPETGEVAKIIHIDYQTEVVLVEIGSGDNLVRVLMNWGEFIAIFNYMVRVIKNEVT